MRVVIDEPPGVTRFTRTSLGWSSPDEMSTSFQTLLAQIHEVPSGSALLIDTRAAPGRNDDEFEATFRRYRDVFFRRFVRVATLIATPVGLLQVNRLQREAGDKVRAFDRESEALRFLLQGPGASEPR